MFKQRAWLLCCVALGFIVLSMGANDKAVGDTAAAKVEDKSVVTTMKKEGFHFRNQIEKGPGGKQIQLEDPDGNPIELFEPAS